MSRPALRNLVDLPAAPPALRDSALVLVDCQNTYTYGVMELDGVQAALEETAALLDRARTAGIPVIHIQHNGGPGSPYDITAEVGVEHCLEALSWSKGILKAEGWARIARVQTKRTEVRLVLNDGREELEVEAEPGGDGPDGLRPPEIP